MANETKRRGGHRRRDETRLFSASSFIPGRRKFALPLEKLLADVTLSRLNREERDEIERQRPRRQLLLGSAGFGHRASKLRARKIQERRGRQGRRVRTSVLLPPRGHRGHRAMPRPHLKMLEHEPLSEQRARLPRVVRLQELQLRRSGSRSGIKRFDAVEERRRGGSSLLAGEGAAVDSSVAHAHAGDVKVERHPGLAGELSTLTGRLIAASREQERNRRKRKKCFPGGSRVWKKKT